MSCLFDDNACCDFSNDDKMSEWSEKINHVGICKNSLVVWRRQTVGVCRIATWGSIVRFWSTRRKTCTCHKTTKISVSERIQKKRCRKVFGFRTDRSYPQRKQQSEIRVLSNFPESCGVNSCGSRTFRIRNDFSSLDGTRIIA